MNSWYLKAKAVMLLPWRAYVMQHLRTLDGHVRELTTRVSYVERRGDDIMTTVDDLKQACDDILADSQVANDKITAAIEHILKTPVEDPRLQDMLTELQVAHAGNVENMTKLQAKLDAVVASGGAAA